MSKANKRKRQTQHRDVRVLGPTLTVEQRALVLAARGLLAAYAPWGLEPGSCLLQAWAMVTAGKQAGRPFRLYAGSAHWPCGRDAEGVLRFGYEWTGVEARIGGRPCMKEIHVWAGDPSTGEFIDLTVGQWPYLARKMGGLDWTAARPPDVLWCRVDALPEGVDYRPCEAAGRYAALKIRELLCDGE